MQPLSGRVEMRLAGGTGWSRVSGLTTVESGSYVRTGFRSKAKISWSDGSVVELGPNSNYQLHLDDSATGLSMTLLAGKLKAAVGRLRGRKFEVGTTNAVCAVRGTEFEVQVHNNNTSVVLYTGSLAVSDNFGNQRLLEPGYSVDVGPNGMGDLKNPAKRNQERRESIKQNLKREVGLNMNKEQVLSAAADEIRLAEYQQGKVMVDVSGQRVRLEQYIMRPAPNQFKLVSLNDRPGRFDYFYYLGTFNTNLPADLSVALGQLGGCVGSACQYNMTGYEVGRSNTTDTVLETASGGHMVDVNANADSSDDVTSYFDGTLNTYVLLNAGDAFFKTFYDAYSIKYNDITFLSWSPVSGAGTVSSYLTGVANGVNKYYITDGGSLGSANGGAPVLNADLHPDGDLMHDKLKLTYGTGEYWEQYDNYLVDDRGKVATLSDFEGLRGGNEYTQNMLKWNFEQVVTCNLFEGRKIDLVIEPKTLIQSNLLQ
ncbi:MAG: FecR family protein [Elusimicrobiaceae bacterium]|nr:FecR family protein [Elusimicrobiaceae bacterium]